MEQALQTDSPQAYKGVCEKFSWNFSWKCTVDESCHPTVCVHVSIQILTHLQLLGYMWKIKVLYIHVTQFIIYL